MQTNSPVLFIIFNRMKIAKQTFLNIREAKPLKLYIAGDGPRSTDEEDIVKLTRSTITKMIDWDCDVQYFFQEKNFGCKWAIINAINWFFTQEEFGIILEDDCLAHLDFFRLCDELNKKYKNDNSIFAISGTNYNIRANIDSDYSFSMLGGNWGWASWRRAWSNYIADIKPMLTQKNWSFIKENFNNDKLYKLFQKVIKKALPVMEDSAWDYQWLFVRCLMNGKSIIPKNNLISNIGFIQNATHTTSEVHPLANLPTSSLNNPLIHPQDNQIFELYDKKIMSLLHPSFYRKICLYVYRTVNDFILRKV
jgi:hypothetical protein